jgi:hypothetical protein
MNMPDAGENSRKDFKKIAPRDERPSAPVLKPRSFAGMEILRTGHAPT